MSGRDQLIAELSAKAGIQSRTENMAQLRADFALVWKFKRHYVPMSQVEYEQQKAAAGQEIRERTGDAEWMADTAEKYALEAWAIRRDRARSERIAAEERAKK